MAQMINVNRQTNDMFYRYKMPRLIAKVEGTGNGIKTVIVNMKEVAKSLSRPPSYITKYFGCELGAQVQMIAKDDRYIVNGAHEGEKLQTLLDGFIKRFVLCPNCDNPETKLSFKNTKSGGEIRQVCAACGHNGSINMASHKLNTYISKFPPDAEGKSEEGPKEAKVGGKSGTKSSKKGKKGDKGAKGGDSDEGSPTENGGSSSHKKMNGATKNGGGDEQDEDEEDWGEDDTISPSMAKLDLQTKSMVQSEDLDKPVAERCETFLVLLKAKKEANKLNDNETIKEILIEAERLEIMEKAPFVVVDALFTENIVKEIDVYKPLLTKLCTKNPKGQKYLLHGLESFIGTNEGLRAKLFNKNVISKILMSLYDNDIVEEDIFYPWHEKASKRYTDKQTAKEFREKANDFIEWLKNAEESTSDEESDDESKLREPEIDFTYQAGSGLEVKVVETKGPVIEQSTIEIDGKTVDIDDI